MRRQCLIIGLLASAASAQAPTGPAPQPAPDTIVVQGRTSALLHSYVNRVARPPDGHQLARWNAPLCIRYEGLADKFSDYIQARIVQEAKRLRLVVSGKGCPTAVVVKLTDQADGLAKALVDMHPPQVGNVTSNTLFPRAEAEAIEAPHVVRWLTASATVNRDGMPMFDGTNKLFMDSLINSPTREDVASKIILIDSVRLANVSLKQLADYITFVILASPDIAADFADTDSILALFAGGARPAPPGMTKQDEAFPDALYSSRADRTVNQQKGAIAVRMKQAGKAEMIDRR